MVNRRLSQVLIELQLHSQSVAPSRRPESRNASESNFAQIDGCDDAVEFTWRSGGGVVAFYRCSRPLMFVYDTYSGTNGHLTPFVGVDSNAISLNIGSTTIATQVRSRDVTAFAN